MKYNDYISYLESYINNLNHKNEFSLELSDLDYFQGKTILITGAAGTIGSAIAKKLSHVDEAKLILLDIAESSLYYLQKEIEKKNCIYSVSDIRDSEKIKFIFKTYNPDIVIHTAAYKQLPFMEEQPYEAISLNINASITLAELAIKYKAKQFIFISTDKAINPTSIMGATKQITEQYISALDSQTKFSSIRFGNVLGSNGSVIPLFINQIDKNQSLTIRNKEVTRYFISISKVSFLIIKSVTINNEANTYLLNMGKAIKILDLAKKLITFSKKDISIKFSQLRPGEKLHEELYSKDEKLVPTSCSEIFEVKSIRQLNVIEKVELFKTIKPETSKSDVIKLIQRVIPNFKNYF